MAQLKERMVREVLNGLREQAIIGNHRTLERVEGGHVFRLHGMPIAEADETTVIFDPCEHPTMTTRSAMEDAAFVFGLPSVSVSFAGGRFTIHMGGVTYLPSPDGTITLGRPPKKDAA